MTIDEFEALEIGDLVRHAGKGTFTYVVVGNYADHVAAARVVDMTNPAEWVLISKSKHEEEEVQ